MMSLRAAVDGGRGWAVVQAHLHPRQVAEAHEFRMFPHALLHTMTYRLTQLGVDLAGDIREATIDRAQPVNDVSAESNVCLVAVNDTKVLGCKWHFDGYESFVTVYRDRWLGALLPSGHPRLLVTK